MVNIQPSKLELAPITMAVVELRFESEIPFAERTNTLLQRVLELGATDIAPANPDFSLPLKLIEANADFFYHSLWTCTYRGFRVTFGPRVIDVFSPVPYTGWRQFLDVVSGLFRELLFVSDVHSSRIGVRYVNAISGSWKESTTVRLSVAEAQSEAESVSIKFAQEHGSHKVTVVLKSEAEGEHTLVDIDVTQDWNDENVSCDDVLRSIELAHELEKNSFFGLLTQHTIEGLMPIYE